MVLMKRMNLKKKMNKKAQVTIFVIIGILLFLGIVGYFFLKNRVVERPIPIEFRPLQEHFAFCLEQTTLNGASILAESGGFIELPAFEPGSSYMPTSNMLDYFGTPIPYWYYISGNNILKENIPTKQSMELQLGDFIEDNLDCDFSSFIGQGYDINLTITDVKTNIEDSSIKTSVSTDFYISFEDKSYKISKQEVTAYTKLGSFHNTALNVLEKEKKDVFLENYLMDILYLYAPVTGVELSCSPKHWVLEDIKQDIKEAVEANFMFVRPDSDYYQLSKAENKYFTFDMKSNDAIRFLYSQEWPTKITAEPNKGGVLISEPVGTQPGMGALGFCYIPYHFVYDLTVPLLIQIYDEKEIFNFPIVMIIKGNMPRESLVTESYFTEPEICADKQQELVVYTFDNNLNPVEAEISFKCFNQLCDVGKTELISGGDSAAIAEVPMCVNGMIIAEAEGYERAEQLISTNEETLAFILMERKHDVEIEVYSEGRKLSDNVFVYFESEFDTRTAFLPEMKNVGLSEGYYNLTVQVYRDSTLKIPESRIETCSDVPAGFIGGLFGVTTEKCFEVTIPAQELDNALVGGGVASVYLTEDELVSGAIKIEVPQIKIPKSLDELQEVYETVGAQRVYVS
jgi:hypothetical protein